MTMTVTVYRYLATTASSSSSENSAWVLWVWLGQSKNFISIFSMKKVVDRRLAVNADVVQSQCASSTDETAQFCHVTRREQKKLRSSM